MCPSMADRDSYTSKPKILSSEVSAKHANPSKHFRNFLYKAIIVTIFIVIVPLLPSQTPEFFNQNLQYSRSWELLQVIFVGIAVSYGLFSKRNDETNKEHNDSSPSKFDNSQSYITRLLQVSSVFDDETENHSVSDECKIQTWNSQYQRGDPVVVVAKESPVLAKRNATTSRIDEKPLLLPVRSLKSRVSEPNENEIRRENVVRDASISRPSSNSGSKFFPNSSGKPRNNEFSGLSPLNVDENKEENVVLRSPIPWRSRSGRMAMKEEDADQTSYSLPPSAEDSELQKHEIPRAFRPQSSRSSRIDSSSPSSNKPSTPSQTPHSSRILTSLPSFSSENQAKSVEDMARRKIYYKSPPPPAPPPPPPALFRKSPLEKSNSSLRNTRDSPEKQLRRSVRSVPNEFIETEIESLSRKANPGPELGPRANNDVPSVAKSVRTIRPVETTIQAGKSREADEDFINGGVLGREVESASNEKRGFREKLICETAPKFRRMTSSELQMTEKEDYMEKVLVETDESSQAESEDDYFEESVGSSGNEVPASVDKDNNADEGPDVDKKADEFIAKFREQIRLQRIESIRRSTEQNARKQSR